MEVDYVYAAEGKPYINYVTVEGAKVKHLRKAIWIKEREELVKYGIGAGSCLSLWKEGEPYQLELNRVLTGGVDPVFKDCEEKKVIVTPLGAATGDAPFVGKTIEPALKTVFVTPLGAASPATPAPGVSKTVEELREELVKPKFSCFVESFINANCCLPTSRDSPLLKTAITVKGPNPCLLLHDLGSSLTDWEGLEKETKESAVVGQRLVPLVGVSGSGKTRLLYEMLSKRWGFYYVGCPVGNGGSADLEKLVNLPKTYDDAQSYVKATLLARFLILDHCKRLKVDFSPHNWLCLQTEFRTFSAAADPFKQLATLLHRQLTASCMSDLVHQLWGNDDFLIVVDEAQVLGQGGGHYDSPSNVGEKRFAFSPVIGAFLNPHEARDSHSVILSGTGLSFLELDRSLVTAVSKGLFGQRYFTEYFTIWTKVDEVEAYVSHLLNLTEEHCEELFVKFQGRRRPLVTCLEHIISKEISGEHVLSEIRKHYRYTTSLDVQKSLFSVVANVSRRGAVQVEGKDVQMSHLLVRLAFFHATVKKGWFICEDKDMALINVGFARALRSPDMSGSLWCTVDEPMMLEALTEYVTTTMDGGLNQYLSGMMIDSVDSLSSLGKIWEKSFCFQMRDWFNSEPKWFEFINKMGVESTNLAPEWASGNAVIVGDTSLLCSEVDTPVEDFLNRKVEAAFFLFADSSGPNVMFLLRFGDKVTPVFCQLKLRKVLGTSGTGKALNTTNPSKMYKRDSAKISASRSAVMAFSEGGFVSLVVVYPAPVKDRISEWKVDKRRRNVKRFVGFLYEEELLKMLPSHHRFLKTVKVDYEELHSKPKRKLELAQSALKTYKRRSQTN